MTDPPDRDQDPDHSPWEGISGAAVCCAGRIVGVISEHHHRDGLNRLAATPFRTACRQLAHNRWQDLADLTGLPRNPTGLASAILICDAWLKSIRPMGAFSAHCG